MTARSALFLGALAGFLTVALGAFGAHVLEPRLTPELLRTWHKAVFYQGLHALAVLACGLLTRLGGSVSAGRAAWAFLLGILFFSGSLYGLVLGGHRILGLITPVGGLAFLVGWTLLAMAAREMDRPAD